MAELFITETAVKERMALGDHADITEAVLSALAAAQTRLESILGVSFQRSLGLVDTFFLNVRHFWSSLPGDLAMLRLSAAFVDKSTVAIRSFRTLEDAMDSTKVGDVVDPKYWVMRKEDESRGIVRVNARYYDQNYIRVTYDAGFTDADDANIPEWLKEAILTKASMVLQSGPTGSNLTPEALSLIAAQEDQVATIIAPHARASVPFTFRPVL